MRNVEDVYPLTPLQRGMLFHCLSAPGEGVYVNQCGFELGGELDRTAFRAAWEHLVERHAVLRTGFFWEDMERPVQVVRRRVDLPWEELDWRGVPEPEREARLTDRLVRDRRRGFDLRKAPLLRLTLVRTGEDSCYFVWTFHHLLLDGWSTALLLDELHVAYRAFARGDTPQLARPLPFRRYVAWLEERDEAAAAAFFRRELAGSAEPTRLDLGPATGEGSGRARVVLDAATSGALRELARRQRLTASTVVQGMWALLASRYTGRGDVLYGLVVSGRPAELPGSDRLLGMLVNTLPARVRVDPAAPAVDWLRELQDRQAELRRFEHASLAEARRSSEMAHEGALFDLLFAFENYPVGAAGDEGAQEHGDGLEIRDLRQVDSSHYPLSLSAELAGALVLRAAFDRGRYGASAVERLLGHLGTLLTSLAETPERPLRELAWLAPGERHQLLREHQGTATDVPGPVYETLHEGVSAVARHRPDAVAVASDEGHLSYGELDRRSAALAARLHRAGIGPETPVGVALERGLDLGVALLAVLRAGGAFLPLDPSYPPARLAQMVEDALSAAPTPVIVAQGGGPELPDHAGGRPVVRVEPTVEPGEAAGGAAHRIRPEHPAYVLFTSGSTGRPKGVVVGHRAIVGHMRWMRHDLGAGPGDRVLLKTPLSFDASLWEVFLPLVSGGCVVLAAPREEADPRALAERAARERVGTLQTVPTLGRLLLEEPGLAGCDALRFWVSGGEPLTEALARRAGEATGASVVNLYGPTEATIDSVWHRVGARGPDAQAGANGGSVPVGRPIAGLEAHVLDGDLALLPSGVEGELFLAGAGLARGYLGRPGWTAERFLPHPEPVRPGARVYRTGDRSRRGPDGALHFLGRRDDQVKVRGARVELAEVETALALHPRVRHAAAAVRNGRLAAWVVPAVAGDVPTAGELRGFLAERLPDHGMPALYRLVETLPRTPSGKLDRRALPEPEPVEPGGSGGELRSDAEEALAGIWAGVLGVERVGRDDDFFALGGDSILSIQIASRARRAGLVVTPQEVFEHRTVGALAKVARDAEEAPGRSPGKTGAGEAGDGRLPLLPMQARFFTRARGPLHHFNQAVLLALAGRFDRRLLEPAAAALLARHDALRLRFADGERGWSQRIEPAGAQPVWAAVDLSRLARERRREVLEELAEAVQASLDLEAGPLTRWVHFDLGGEEARLLWTAHHLAVDAVSWGILLDELDAVRRDLAAGRPPWPGPATTSLARWSLLLASRARSEAVRGELDFWLSQGEPAAATAHRPPPVREEAPPPGAPGRLRVELDPETTRALLTEVPPVYRSEIQDALLAALTLALTPPEGPRRLLLELEGHGRDELGGEVDLTRTVGWLTSLYPLLLDAGGLGGEDAGRDRSPGEEMAAALAAIKEQLRRVPRKGLGYGLLRHLAGEGSAERLARAPEPEVGFNYLGQIDRVLAPEGPYRAAPESAGRTSAVEGLRHPLEVAAFVSDGRLTVEWTFDPRVRSREEIERAAERFLAGLATLVDHCREPTAGGATLSDFPDARLDESELERLAGLLGGAGGSER